MTFPKNALVGLLDGMGTGVYLGGYIFKKTFNRNFYSHGEAVDTGKLTIMKADRNSLEYQVAKGVGDVMGIACGASNLFLIGLLSDIVANKYRKRHSKKIRERLHSLLLLYDEFYKKKEFLDSFRGRYRFFR